MVNSESTNRNHRLDGLNDDTEGKRDSQNQRNPLISKISSSDNVFMEGENLGKMPHRLTVSVFMWFFYWGFLSESIKKANS